MINNNYMIYRDESHNINNINNNYMILHHLGYLSNKGLADYNLGVKGVDLMCKIDLPMTPAQINDNNSANFSQQTILSRSAPVYSYISTGPRTITWSMKLHREMMDDMDYSSYNVGTGSYKSLNTIKSERGSLEVLTECLQLVVVPTYTNSTMVIPPKVTIKIENLKITGIVRSIQSTWELPIVNNKYMVVTHNLSVEEIDPYDSSSILRLGGYRGL